MDERGIAYTHPLISVIIPAYNAEAFIEKTLSSVLSQTYKNIEVIVVDDGSQDRTVEIVKLIAQLDRRIKLIQQPNKGVAAARNLAIEKSQGEFIAPIDADDIWYPQKLEKQLQCMLEADPSVGLVYAWSVYIDEWDLLTGGYQAFKEVEDVRLNLLIFNAIGNGSAPLFRRSCIEQIGGYNCRFKEENAQGCEDRDLYLRIAENYQFRVVPEFLIGYRQTNTSMSHNLEAMLKSHLLVAAEAQKRHPEIPAIIYRLSLSRFCLYISGKYSSFGKEWSSLVYLYQAVKLDPIVLLNFYLYKLTFKRVVKLLIRPLVSLVWKDYDLWLESKQQVKRHRSSKITISDIYNLFNKNNTKYLRNPYNKIKTFRMSKIKQKYFSIVTQNR